MHETSPIPVTVVFDIGKTNKKILLFDSNYEVVYQQYITMKDDEIHDEDGDPCENLANLVDWVKLQFEKVMEDARFDIQALNFSTYGASLVHLNDQGELVTPLYNYMKPYPEALQQQFYQQYGGKERFSLETASPPMGMLNSGLQLYWLKYNKPSLYNDIQYTLHFPQYLSSVFTGEYTAEYTSIGCHTGMWNYEEEYYHDWLKQENMLRLFPDIKPATNTRKGELKAGNVKVGTGMHDSSAALVPYLYAVDNPFLLVSTGTWSIVMNPFSDDQLTYEELKKDCLCYLNMKGEQVKASRFFMGNEYDYQNDRLEKYFDQDQGEEIELNETVVNSLIETNSRKLVLETVQQSGPYPGNGKNNWALDSFSSYEEAYHQLILDLVSIQADCIRLAEGSTLIDTLIITGGFAKNNIFIKLLASRFPNKSIYTASLPNASALGASLVVSELNKSHHETIKKRLKLKRHDPIKKLDITEYTWRSKVNE